MTISNLNDLYVHTLKDIYYAENKILKALPKMAKKADSAQLRTAFEQHLTQTEGHVKRLEQVFQICGEKPSGEKCPAINGIIDEAEELMGEIKDADTRDAAMIAAAQAVEHYEITRYGTLVSWSNLLGLKDAARILEQTLAEEKDTDLKLTRLAESRLNREAA